LGLFNFIETIVVVQSLFNALNGVFCRICYVNATVILG